MDNGKAKTYTEALQALIGNHFKGFHKYKFQSGQDFRDRHVWNLEIDDLMKSNLDSIKKLYTFFLSADMIDPITNKAYTVLTLPQCQEIGSHLDLTLEQVSEAYSYCKMILVDELKDYGEYKKLKIVEFCDLIVRLADTRFKSEAGLNF
jgi:hypothetical protein